MIRAPKTSAAALLSGVLLTAVVGLAGPAFADTASPSPSPSASDAPPTEAGTNFRTAAVVQQGQLATASASTGDYLYWVFPADTGQNVTVRATVSYPQSVTLHGTTTWQLDVYDGLRRHQACRYGSNTVTVPAGATEIGLACHLRTIRANAEPWSNDPLRGAYYARLTAVDVPSADLGLPVATSFKATSEDAGASAAVDGSVTPVVSRFGPDVRPSDGWASTWWSGRWLWTAAGGLLAALAGVGGYTLARGRGRPHRVPPQV